MDLKGERLSKLENYILQRNNRRNNEMFEVQLYECFILNISHVFE